MVAAILLATAAASAPSTSSCPPAPPGFTRLPSHCVGSDGSCSKTPLKSGDCSPDTVAACFAAAARECETSHECNSFAILAGGGASCTVSHAGPPRWHIYSEAIESIALFAIFRRNKQHNWNWGQVCPTPPQMAFPEVYWAFPFTGRFPER